MAKNCADPWGEEGQGVLLEGEANQGEPEARPVEKRGVSKSI